jgi:uncharacterized protein (TIRG00374 family)
LKTETNHTHTPDDPALLREFAVILTEQRRNWIWAWLPGFLLLIGLIFLTVHFAELQVIADLLRGARTEYLIPALFLQLGTYVCAATVWWLALSAFGHSIGLRGLLPLGFAKLFLDQAVPTGGMSGTLLVVAGLIHRSVSFEAAVLTLLTSLISYYAVYPVMAILSVAILAVHHRDSVAAWSGLAVLMLVSAAIPLTVFALRKNAVKVLPPRLRKFRIVQSVIKAIAGIPVSRLRNPVLLAQTSALQAAIFLLDGMTLWIAFQAIGSQISLPVAFSAHVLGTVAATLGPTPLGLGTFEAGAVAVLASVDVPLEVGLSAVLYTRALTFWLPMLPGLWLARREFVQARSFVNLQ